MKIKALFGELRKRSVFKVAIAYLAVSWLLVQVAGTAQQALHLPAWAPTLVWVLLAIGFPIALVLAWAYDLTPQGLRLTPPHGLTLPPGAAEGPPPALAAPAVPPEAATALASVSVLPFQNLVASGEYAYVADAMTIELHALLSRCHDVRVVSHQSSASRSIADSSLRAISSELGVQYVITGSVVLHKDRFVVTVELDDALKDTVLWSERYEIDIDDLWDVQRKIAETVVGTFGGERLRAEIKRASETAPGNESARQLVQKARAYLLDYGADRIVAARSLLERAVELDPDHAYAHAALGLVVAEATLNGAADNLVAARKTAAAAIDRAVLLAPSDPEVLRAAGCVHAYTGAYAQSLSVLRRATSLAPFDLGTWGYLGWPLVATGRSEDLAELHAVMGRLLTSVARHPGRAYWLFHESVAYACEDDCERAAGLAEKSMSEQPGFSLGLVHYANVQGRLGRLDAARSAATKCAAMNPRMTPAFYADLMRVLTDQSAVVERRTSGLRSAGLLAA